MSDQEEPKTETEQAPPTRKARRLWLPLALLILLLLAGGLAALYAFPLPKEWTGWLAFPETQPETQKETQKETDVLSARVAALEEAFEILPQTSQGTTAQLNAIETDLASLDGRLAALESQIFEGAGGGEAASQAEIEALRTAVEGLAAQLADLVRVTKADPVDPVANRRFLAVEGLCEGLWEYGPFRERLMDLLAVAGEDPIMKEAVAPIAAYADRGIATLPMLRARYDAMASAALKADRLKPDANWTEKLLANLSSVLTIRRTGDFEGDGLEAVLARAELALEAGDLERGVALLRGIEGPAGGAMESWLRDAEARLAAEAAIRRLRQLAFPGGAKPSAAQP
ncbi:MAG: mitofilin family membrane protein [Pseudomonadota bacterium]